jgi:hypothetical protein
MHPPVTFETVENCARCGGTHLVAFRPFTRPNPFYGEFGVCPVTAEPILVRYAVGPVDGTDYTFATLDAAQTFVRSLSEKDADA